MVNHMKFIKEWIAEQWKEKRFRILTGVMAVLMVGLCIEGYLFTYSVLKSIRYLWLVAALFVIAWIDGQKRIIPNRLLLVLSVSRLLLLLIECVLYREYWMSLVISAGAGFLIGGGMFFLCYFLTRGGVGAGDVKLLAVVGFYLGSGLIFTAVFLTVLYAAVYNIVKLLRRKTTMKQEIPFAPFVLLGTITTIFLGV